MLNNADDKVDRSALTEFFQMGNMFSFNMPSRISFV